MSSSSIPPSTFYSRPTFNGIPKSQLVGSSGSSSTLGLGLPSGHTGGNGAGPSGTRKRSASPDLSMTTDGDGQRPNKQHRSTGSWNATNGSGLGPGAGAGSGSGFSRVKSEDDFARRGNTAVEQPRTGAVDGTGKEGEGSYRRDDTPGFIGRRYLREQLGKHLSDKATIPEDVLTYLSSATETYLRTLMRSSLSAQVHRTCTSHTRAPPFAIPDPSSAPGSKRSKLTYDDPDTEVAKPLWSHTITSDPAAVINLLSAQNRKAEMKFRMDRMDRIAQDQKLESMARAQREAEMAANGGVLPAVVPANGDVAGHGQGSNGDAVSASPYPAGTSAGPADSPSTPVPETPGTPAPSASAPAAPTPLSATPTFGATPQPNKRRKWGGDKKASASSMSTETQLRMSNAQAARATGLSSKKYSWMSNAPSLSSPLAGKKGKKAKGKEGMDGGDDAEGEGSEAEGSGNGEGSGSGSGGGGLFGSNAVGAGGKAKRRSNLSKSTLSKEITGSSGKKRKVAINKPTRRMVSVVPVPNPSSADSRSDTPGLSGIHGATQGPDGPKVPDDRAICFTDVIFALKRDTSGVDALSVARQVSERRWARDRQVEQARGEDKAGRK